ncbi:conjugal transfer protein TrbH [Rhizobium sp. BT-226]|uniref:conjugal transfer protein TrbH n=1 Tax=Rhizobium sp. BT-226 TaxID=2986922 RepID=UPI0021F78A00|nr:conjugal transfer protein TrbH [Rhizobium sp. BT-226]MCW0021372.1 conjugal transfer protein TrbH [Rhizobium sp. BT-226]
MHKLFAFIVMAALLAGCQTADDALDTHTAPAAISGLAASAVAGDMASRLAEQIGRGGTTTIKMKKDSSEFAATLEAALKGWGYTVIVDQKVAKDVTPLELAWSIGSMDGQILAQLSTPSIAISRAYLVTPAGATPASPLSIMQRS